MDTPPDGGAPPKGTTPGHQLVDGLYGVEITTRAGRRRLVRRVSSAERRVLLVLVEPNSAGISAAAIAARASVSEGAVLRLPARAEFLERVRLPRRAA